MSHQFQIFKNEPLDKGDVVYTPEWVVKDMISFFNPSGRILEPCCGDGAFLAHLPAETLWCEIQQGRDFFEFDERVDWIIGNPPYKMIREWLQHSFTLSDNIVYLIPMNSPFNSMKRMKDIFEWGGIEHIRAYGNGSIFGMNYGFAVGAFHFKKNGSGATHISVYGVALAAPVNRVLSGDLE
jgi:hypothetical protein